MFLFDLTDRALIELCGADRHAFLHNFCTNDVNKLRPGEGCEAFVTDVKGRILGHILISAAEDALWIDSVAGTNEVLVDHLDKYLIIEDVQVHDRTAESGSLCLVGPHADAWLRNKEIDVSDLTLWGRRPASLMGHDVIVRRVGFTLPTAFELVTPRQQLPTLREEILATDVTEGGRDHFEALRIEAGFPHFGIDVTDENIAQEAGRTEQAISFTKGCYLGQEPIARLDALGHANKELRRLKLSAGPVPECGTPVRSTTGEEVGRVTSAAQLPNDDRPVALAMLKTVATAEGTTVDVGGTSAIVT